MSSIKDSYSRGVPVLSDIPYLGYLFKVTSDREYRRECYFVVTMLPVKAEVLTPAVEKFSTPLLDASSFFEKSI